MSLLNAQSTILTAWIRTFWVGLGSFVSVAAPFYLAHKSDMGKGDAIEEAVIWGLCAIFGVGVVRGGVEGTSDAIRDSKGNVKPGDVGQPSGQAARRRREAAADAKP